MKILFLSLLLVIATNQATVIPKLQSCQCSSLMFQADCLAKSGCQWILDKTTNLTYNQILNQQSSIGSCANSTITAVATEPPTYCLNVTSLKLCAQTIGCAFLNNTCTIFSGCTAYVKTSNEECQAISNQCISDGTRCISPSDCQSYKTQAICIGSISTSGAKSCKWISDKCVDKVCSDAPATYTTQAQCTGWIVGCLTNGKGCAISLDLCSSYTQANGCSGMLGSDGPCTTDTSAGSTVCRPLVCSDAPQTLYTNKECSSFVSGCLTNGKGCVTSLSTCSTYTQIQVCSRLIGSDGPCTANRTAGSTACRAWECTEAPTSINTNAGCASFLAGCVTTGSGCTNSLGPCSSYTGTTTTCSPYIGTDGNCKGTSATAGSCSARTCVDAPTTTNTNAACAAFQTGCLTTGAGCTAALGSCSSYSGTKTSCTQYIGSDGNCTAPSSQIISAPCSVKLCKDAPNTFTTNAACFAYSYLCVTNGAGCTAQVACEATTLAISCQGTSNCSQNKICLNRSDCSNYLNQAQCLLNKQQYSSGGFLYLRSCTWSLGICYNQVCSALSISLTTDEACSNNLAGCLTNGSGCLDISAPCASYQGTQQQCNLFKGLNGTQRCGQIVGSTSLNNCIARSCSNANQGVIITSDTDCSNWLAGCNFDGKDNCSAGDCTTYYGTQAYCGQITTAKSGGKLQQCWKNFDPADNTSACIEKTCSQAPFTLRTNQDCNSFLAGCVTNGVGCVSPDTQCNQYFGNLNVCNTFKQNGMACSKQAAFCRSLDCTLKAPPTGTANNKFWCQSFVDAQGNNCQYDLGPNCISSAAGTCSKFVPTSGSTDGDKALSCYNLKLDGTLNCGFETGGSSCASFRCDQFILSSSAITGTQKATLCKALTTDSSDIFQSCGLALTSSTACSMRACTDFGIEATDDQSCQSYLYTCKYAQWGYCYLPAATCDYTIPVEITTDLQKVKFCSAVSTTDPKPCTYQAATSTTNCSPPAVVCTNIFIPKVLASDSEKLAFCRESKMDDGQTCVYVSSTATTCAMVGACNSYPAIGTTDDEKQLSCAGQIDNSSPQQNCVYISGAFNCATATLINCTTVTTLGATAVIKQAVCNAYTANSKKCGYALPSTAATCTDAECYDVATPSIASCPAYLSYCVYDGFSCVAWGPCSSYNAQLNSNGPLINCSNLKDYSGNKCKYLDGTKCTARSCTDAIANPSAANCQEYLSTCLFNGSSCIAHEADCANYTPSGATDSAKAAICNSLMNLSWVKCTYIAGSINCINTMSCVVYQLPQKLQNIILGQQACALIQDINGDSCAYDLSQLRCTAKTCQLAIMANSDEDCNNWLVGCDQNPISPCSLLNCQSAPITYMTNQACDMYRKGCLTNGSGCVEPTVTCSEYRGTKIACNNFVGNSIPCTNFSGALSTDNCVDRTCIMNTTAKSDADCTAWYPSTTEGSANCVWNGSLGCVPPQNCASFYGTIDTCPIFTATDGPCSGKSAVYSPCFSNNLICTGAPRYYNTDAQCKSWGSSCMTTGFGCIYSNTASCQSISSYSACSLYKSIPGLNCDLADQCMTQPITCNQFTTASECNNIPLAGSTALICAWDHVENACVYITCAFLPATLTTDSACSSLLSSCTTNGAGCVIKGPCQSYSKLACINAAATDSLKGCIWSKSTCRPIQCTDNTTATSDAACNTYLEGCRTTGTGCTSVFPCSIFTSPQYCLTDSSKSPCLWYKSSTNAKGNCINYKQCTDLIQLTHSACQAASPFCTTNGQNCIPITGCSQTLLQISCNVGTDGTCGWMPASGTNAAACALFSKCSDAAGKTNVECQAWGSSCISNGTTCTSKQNCSSYSTVDSCKNTGTDGKCVWVPSIESDNKGTCRVQICSDATTNTKIHAGCAAFQAQTPCTTSGTGCIPQSTCSSYKTQAGCIQGTDGICFWAISTIPATSSAPSTTITLCRLKQCQDSILTSSASCGKVIKGVKCVSNGIYCIPQSTCSSYTSREACLGGGSDGGCAFTPGVNSTTPNIGTCVKFQECANANFDSIACKSRSDVCYFNSTILNGTLTTSCSPHTCITKSQGSYCQPVPSWDLQSYQICVLIGPMCVAGNAAQLTASTCYLNSAGTYTWNVQSSSCVACVQTTTPNTTTNSTNSTNDSYGCLIGLMITIIILL